MLGFRFSYLYRLHSESLMGLNAVCLPGTNPSGAVYRSSLPATPVSTPIRENSKFSEQALRDRLCRTPSPRKTFFDSRPSVPDIGLTSLGLNCLDQGWPLSPAESECSNPYNMNLNNSPPQNTEDTPSYASDNMELDDSEASLGESSVTVEKPKKIFVCNISLQTSVRQLRRHFSKFGTIIDISMVRDHIRNTHLGYGFISFENSEDAQKALVASPEELKIGSRNVRVHATTGRKTDTLKKKYRDALLQKKNDDYINKGGEDQSLYMSDLNDDVLRLIFSYLNMVERIKIERVCKRWQEILLRLWRKEKELDFSSFNMPVTNQAFQSVLKRCGAHLLTLDISSSNLCLDYQALEIVGYFCHKLESLNISTVKATNVSLHLLAVKCPRLKKLILQNAAEIGEKGIWWIFNLCKDLEYIDLTSNKRISGQFFHMTGPMLKTAILNNCFRLSPVGFSKLATRCIYLKTLCIDNCSLLNDKSLDLLAQSLKNLTTLSLGGDDNELTSTGLYALGRFYNLEHLNINHNSNMDDNVMTHIVQGCTKLRSLDISGSHLTITNDGIKYLAQLNNLTTFKCNYNTNISAEGLNPISKRSLLEEVELKDCFNLTDHALVYMLYHCPNLRKLDVSACINLTEEVIQTALETVCVRKSTGVLELAIGGTAITRGEESRSNDQVKIEYFNKCAYHKCSHHEYYPSDEEEILGNEDASFSDSEDFPNMDDPLVAEEIEGRGRYFD